LENSLSVRRETFRLLQVRVLIKGNLSYQPHTIFSYFRLVLNCGTRVFHVVVRETFEKSGDFLALFITLWRKWSDKNAVLMSRPSAYFLPNPTSGREHRTAGVGMQNALQDTLYSFICSFLRISSPALNYMKFFYIWDDWEAVLQAGKSLVRVSMRSLNCFNWPNPSSRTMALGMTQSLTKMSIRRSLWGQRTAGA
jgi:hypothetical protein